MQFHLLFRTEILLADGTRVPVKMSIVRFVNVMDVRKEFTFPVPSVFESRQLHHGKDLFSSFSSWVRENGRVFQEIHSGRNLAV